MIKITPKHKTMKVIKYENLPARKPLLFTAVLYLFLDKFNAPGYVWGICGTLMLLFWIGYFAKLYKQEKVDIFKKKSDESKES